MNIYQQLKIFQSLVCDANIQAFRFYRYPDEYKGLYFNYPIDYNHNEIRAQIFDSFIVRPYLKYLKERPAIIFDIGSSYGITALSFCHFFPYATVYAFEPNPHVFEYMNNLIEINSVMNRVCAFNFGIGVEGKITLYVNKEQFESSNRFLRYTRDSEQVLVQSYKLSTILSNKGILCIDLLKMDIEGDEFLVIEDLIHSGLLSIVRNLSMEVHLFKMETVYDHHHTISYLLSSLNEKGFKVKCNKTGNDKYQTRYMVWGSQKSLI